jgi:alpha-D-xyloside xylohydrolase
MAGIGNAWHIPQGPEPAGQTSMRSPLASIATGTDVLVFTGNQFQGPGVAGNQTESGSSLLVRKAGGGPWSPLPLRFHSEQGNNKYFVATIPSNAFQAGNVVEYYCKIGYTDRPVTFVHGDDGASSATAVEATAQAGAFTFTIAAPAAASSPFLFFDSGPHQARIFRDSGQLAIAGPDLAGNPHANVVIFEPPSVILAGGTFSIGRVLSSAPLANGLEVVQELGAGQVRAQLTFPVEGILRYEVLDWKGAVPSQISIAAPSDANEHFYGFGEKFNLLDQAGRVVNILTFDDPGKKGDRSYKVAPWFVSTRGYGVLLDSTARCVFDMRVATGRYSLTSQGASLRINVVYGPKLTDVVSRYTGMTGRPALPPPWAFGTWISSDIWRNGGEVRYAVTKFRERNIPVSAFVFDSPWEVAYNDFRFNETQFSNQGAFEGKTFQGFPNTAQMMTFLRENGLKVICWMAPFVNVSSDPEGIPGQNLKEAGNYQDGIKGNFFVRASPGGAALVVPWWKGRGSPIDFTKKEARNWLTKQLTDLLAASEVSTKAGKEPAIGGFKPDDGESGNGTNVYIPDTAAYSNGLTGREFVNGYCSEYHKTVYNVLGANGLIFARSGFTGTQAFPGCWAGDNEPNFGADNGLPSVITAGLSAAISGFSIWGHDVGAYQNSNFSPVSPADLFMRWTQFGCFSPIMQMHRQVNNSNLRQYPWGYPEGGESADNNKALANYKFYATLHMRLFPYLYSLAKQSGESGLPILRPLVMMHQDDPQTFPVQHVYYFGANLLVAPVIEPLATQRQVYLPEGDWFDFWTNEKHTGKQLITWKNPAQPVEPASKIPVFVKSGAILPLILGEQVQTLCDANYVNNPAVKTWEGGLEIRVFPAGASQFDIFDGTVIQSNQASGSTTITIDSPTARPVLLRILAPPPASVQLAGTVLQRIAAQKDFDAASAGWFVDAPAGFILVKFALPTGTTKVAL